jgi:glucose/arabinose dehydrogenase
MVQKVPTENGGAASTGTRSAMNRVSSISLLCAGPLAIVAAAQAAVVPDDFVHETILTGLSEPNSLTTLPDGRLLFTEQRTAKVRMVVNDHIAATDPLLVVPSVVMAGYEQGVQGIAVDSQWPSRPYLYLFHNRTGGFLRLVRYTATGALTDRNAESLTLGSPMILIDNIPDAATNHNGGTLRFGPDGHLYLSIGEDADQCAAQDSTRLKGQLLRLRVSTLPASGAGPVPRAFLIPTTPALSSPDSNAKLVFAYGLRNPWRFHIDSTNGAILLGDVGEGTYEELDEVRPGDNLGWPFREGYAIRSPGPCSEPGGSGQGGYDPPIIIVNHSIGAKAILSAGVYRPMGGAGTWPTSYHGNCFYSDYALGYLRRLTKSGSTWTTPSPVAGQPNSTDWATGLTYPVDFVEGRDGSLWCLSQFNSTGGGVTGSLSRIRYVGSVVAGVPGAGDAALSLSGSPNPFSTTTQITFSLARADHVRLAAFDAKGRRMRTLVDADLAAGAARVTWDGADERGDTVPPGLYFLQLTHGGATGTTRLLRMP